MRQRLVIVDASGALTGAFRAAANTALALAGDMDTVLVLARGHRIPADQLALFAAVHEIPMVQLRRSVRDLALYLPALLAGSLQLRRLLDPERDRLVLNDFILLQGWMLRRLGYRGFIGAWVRRNPRDFPRRLSDALLSRVLATSDRVFVVARHLLQHIPAIPKVGLLYDPIVMQGLGEPSPWPRPAHVVYVANYIRGKGQEHALSAWPMVAAAHPDAELHFWGGDMGLEKNRAFRRELEARAATLPGGDRIRFHDFSPAPAAVLGAASVALNLSESEALSYGSIEAGQAATPLVATRCGGPEEIVVDGETGYLVPRGDAPAIADRIGRLLADRAAAARMGEAAAAHVAHTFSAEAYRRGMLDAFEVRASKAAERA